MHETYIADCLLRQVKESLPSGLDPRGVSIVRVTIGCLDAIVPDSLVYMFNAIRGAYDLPNARLEIDLEQVRCQCRDCDYVFLMLEPLFVCPHCHGVRIKLLSGRGITLIELDVKEDYIEDTDCTKRT